MKQVAVQFSSVDGLIDFVHDATASVREVNEEAITLTYELSEEDLDHALTDYHATIVNGSDHEGDFS